MKIHRFHPSHLWTIVGAALLVALAAGCGGEEGGSRAGSEEGSKLQERAWNLALGADDGRTVRIYYQSNPAFRLEEVEIQESVENVTVTLRERVPSGPYTTEGVIECREISLRRPLNNREIIDGSRGVAPGTQERDQLPVSLPSRCTPPAAETKIVR